MTMPIVPAFEITNSTEEELHCAACDKVLSGLDWCVCWGDEYCCEDCSERLVLNVEAEAEKFAKEKCEIFTPLPKFNPALEYRCTPEQYESGIKLAYTRNSHLCDCRHNCTNYDELIKPLSRLDLRDRYFYEAIRERIDGLLIKQIKEDGDEGEFDEDDEA